MIQKINEPSYIPKQILLRKGVDDTNTDYIDRNVGIFYPLIRINNTSIEPIDIVSFTLSIGTDFLPYISLTVKDRNYSIRESDFGDNIRILTLFIANNLIQEYEKIKLDFLIDEISSAVGGETISYSCRLFTDKLYDSGNVAFSLESTSYEFIKTIAIKCGLGFKSNITNSNDKQIWIQRKNENLIEFVTNNSKYFYISDTDYVHIFVDQYMYVNYISIERSINNQPSDYINKNVLNGNNVEPFIVKLSNNKFYNEDLKYDHIPITFWTPLSDYGNKSSTMCNTLNIDNRLDNKTKYQIQLKDNKTQLKDALSLSLCVDTDNTHENYVLSQYLQLFNTTLLQNNKIVVEIENYVNQLYMFQSVFVDIYNSMKSEEIKDQINANKDIDMLQNDKTVKSFNYSLNPSFTSIYIIQEMIIKFGNTNYMKTNNDYGQMYMKLKMTKTK